MPALDICTPETDWSFLTDEDLGEIDDDRRELAEQYAWSMLASLCNYRIGTCPITVRPCAERCAPEGSFRPAIAGRWGGGFPSGVVGRVYTQPFRSIVACGCRAGGCSCVEPSTVYLPGPVGKIERIMIDGAELPRSAYRVLNGNRLIRADGEGWPVCQDLSLSDEEGFSVTYYRGSAPNRMTAFAAGILANEYILLWNSSPECRLPANLEAMTRSGESYNFQQLFPNGRTGIMEVDSVIEIYNPHGLRAPVIIASPDSYNTPMRTA